MGGFGGPTTASGSNQNTQGANAGSTDNSNPFLLACNQMFQDFDKISKEEQQQQIPKPSTGAGPQSAAGSTSGPQGMPNLEGLGGMGDDPMFMNLLNTFAKDLLNGDPSAQEGAFDSLMNQFSDFMKDTENNEEMKTALESVVQEIIKKDTLYEPMKTLRDEYPKWLEENWQTVNQEDLERYNKQLDKITEICNIYENNKSADETLVFEKLAELQELGSPPQDLMKKVGDQGFGPGNPFQNL